MRGSISKSKFEIDKGNPNIELWLRHARACTPHLNRDISQTKKKRKENKETSSERLRSTPVFRSETRHAVCGEDFWKHNFLSMVSPFFLSLLINHGALRNSLSVIEKPSSTVSQWGRWLKWKSAQRRKDLADWQPAGGRWGPCSQIPSSQSHRCKSVCGVSGESNCSSIQVDWENHSFLR